MVHLTHTFAAAEAGATEKSDLLGSLGIDWRLLLLQVVAFGVLVWLLGKFVYPHLIKAIDKREKAIADSLAAATKAEAHAERSQKEIDELFRQARSEASEIIEMANKEAANALQQAEEKAKARSEQLVADARTQLDADVRRAREAMKSETIKLVALATEKVVSQKLDDQKDATLIKNALSQEQA